MISCLKCGQSLQNQQVLKVHLFFKHPELKVNNPFLEKNQALPLVSTQAKFNLFMPQIKEQIKEAIEKTSKMLQEKEKKTEDALIKEKKTEEALAQINQLTEKFFSLETKINQTEGKIKTFCDTYPDLCKKVEALEKKLELKKKEENKEEELLKPKEVRREKSHLGNADTGIRHLTGIGHLK
jgi:predicted nuclease with TOPRIM domain